MVASATSPFRSEDLGRAAQLVERCRGRGWMLATAESCTGGLVAALLTEVAGSSAVVDRGFVTYSNEAKIALVGVDPLILARHGAVSAETAGEMARGALDRSQAHCAVAITGIAGPGGGSDAKPVGLVFFGLAVSGAPPLTLERRFGDLGRAAVRHRSMLQALMLIEDALGRAEPSTHAVP